MSSGCFLALRSPLTASFYQVWWYVQSIGRTKVNQSFSHGIFKTRLILVLSLPYWGYTNLCTPLKSPRNVGLEARWLRKTLFSKHALKHTLKPLPLTPVLITCQCFSLPGNKHCWLLTFILYGQHLKGIECYCKSNFHRAKRKQLLPFMLIFFVFLMVGIKGNFVNQQIYIKIKYRHNIKPCHLCLWHLIWLLILSQFFVVGRSANKWWYNLHQNRVWVWIPLQQPINESSHWYQCLACVMEAVMYVYMCMCGCWGRHTRPRAYNKHRSTKSGVCSTISKESEETLWGKTTTPWPLLLLSIQCITATLSLQSHKNWVRGFRVRVVPLLPTVSSCWSLLLSSCFFSLFYCLLSAIQLGGKKKKVCIVVLTSMSLCQRTV